MDAKYKIHAFYVLLFLGSAIVILVSVKWGEIPSLVQYFSFALTLSSLLLAVLAIIYSFYSSSSNSQNISLLSILSDQIAQSASNLGAASVQITKQVEELPSHLKLVQGKVEETQSLIKEYYAKQLSSEETHKVADVSLVSKALADYFLTMSSRWGLLLIYACELGSKKSKGYELSFEDFASKVKMGPHDYLFGFAVAAVATGLVTGSTVSGSIKIQQVNPHLLGKVKPYLVKKAETSASPEKEQRLEEIARVDSYFSS